MSDDETPCSNLESTASDPGSNAASLSRDKKKLAEKQRLVEALRDNLRRRKAQARGRRAEAGGNSGSADE